MKHTITICMGSSCYARGNGENLETIEQHIAGVRSHVEVELLGCRCRSQCGNGPNIEINGTLFTHVSPPELEQILKEQVPE